MSHKPICFHVRYWFFVSRQAFILTSKSFGIGKNIVVPIIVVGLGLRNYFKVYGGEIGMEELGKFLWGTVEPLFVVFWLLFIINALRIPATTSASELLLPLKTKDKKNILNSILFFLTGILGLIILLVTFIFSYFGYKNIIYPSPTPTPTPTVTDVVDDISEIEMFPYENIEEVPECDFDELKHHCIYYVEENVNDYSVAIKAYSEKRFQGKIKEFYRDEKGGIPKWIVGGSNFTLIPPLEMDLELNTKYFALLNISKCDKNATNKPCWQEADVESYETLPGTYYGNADYIDCIKRANKIEYDAGSGELKPMDIKIGDIIVLPICD